VRFRGAYHLLVEHEAVDKTPPPSQLERLNAQAEPAVELGDCLVESPVQEKAHARDQQPVEHGDERERDEYADKPDRQFDRCRHRSPPPAKAITRGL
jgi:hypothetical protein